MLYQVLKSSEFGNFKNYVIVLTNDSGPIACKIKALHVPIYSLEMKPGQFSFGKIWELVKIIKEIRPHLVQTWLYHADLLGSFAVVLFPHLPIVWGIHHANLDSVYNKRSTIWVARICSWLSGLIPKKIIVCSQAGMELHRRFGYAAKKMIFIPNGVDTTEFVYDSSAKEQLHLELLIPIKDPLIGMAARYHPLKNHETFLIAASLLLKQFPEVHFILCGDGIDDNNLKLSSLIHSLGITQNVHLLGIRTQMSTIFSALDIGTLTSISEAFPLVVGEMMACELPCVITNVGDCAALVDGCGLLIPSQSVDHLVEAWSTLLLSESYRKSLGKQARNHIIEHFSLQSSVQQYLDMYSTLIDNA